MPFHIAIDGPVAAGKGTVSRLVADELGFDYIDTGAMYRMSALLADRNHIGFREEEKIVELIKKADMDLHTPTQDQKDGRLITAILDGEDVSWKIRTERMGKGASIVSELKGVRKVLVEKQQQIAQNKNVVMEGRDITYRVLPNADLKIFLTASDLVRAKRRHTQLLVKGENVSFQEVHTKLLKRDKFDSTRENDPLKITDDAWVIDTSNLTIPQVAAKVVQKVKSIQQQNG